MTFSWPDGLYPRSQKFYLRHPNTKFLSSFTGQFQVLEREGVRWVAEFEFELENERARSLDGLIAALRGSVEQILVPDFRRNISGPVTDSMNAYADEIGITFFDDHYDFTDQTHEEGLLTVEESPPLGTEDNALFGSGFDAILIFEDEITLLTEAGLTLLADNVGIPFETDRGYIITLEHGDALEIAAHEGYILQTQNWEDVPLQVGGGFFEGVGESTLVEGGDRKLLIGGLAPLRPIIKAGQSIMPSLGHAHLILDDVVTDINGFAAVSIAPKLRTTITEQPLVLGGIQVLMRLSNSGSGGDAGDNRTVPPNRSSYTLTFEQVLN